MSGRRSARPGRLYGIADAGLLGAAAVPSALATMAEAGLSTLQLRAKRLVDRELWNLVGECLGALAGWSGTFWIDDRADLARRAGVAGVHLGQRDLPPAAARPIVGEERLIGLSTHGERELVAAERDPEVDWIALGPVFATATKEDPDPELGTVELARLRRLAAKPLVAIGGITAENLGAVLASGVDAAAIVSALCRGDVRANARRLVAAAGSPGE